MNATQMKLFKTNRTWMTYVGGYYADTQAFIQEAEGPNGITRRVPVQTARGMRFGDRVVLLRWQGEGKAQAFGEMRITSITLEGETAKRVGERLIAEGRATFTSGGGLVERACGSYFVVGTLTTSADIDEILATAQELAGENEKVSVMVGGRIDKLYEQPVLLLGKKFFRGFALDDCDATYEYAGDGKLPENQVVAIGGYQKKARPTKRRSGQAALPLMLGA